MESTIPRIHSDVDLTPFNTLGVSAIASQFVRIESNDQLIKLFESGFFENRDPFILGGGSNVLFLDNPSQPIVQINIQGINILSRQGDSVIIEVGAGENWHELVTWAVEQDFGGIENLALIPGTVGAAPIQNIGAYGVEFEEKFDSLVFFDLQEGIFKTYRKEDCRFGYRDSIFKHDLKGKAVITSVRMILSTGNHDIVDTYNSLKSYLSENDVQDPSIRDIYKAVIDIRRAKLPDPDMIGNAGSFFKNPVISTGEFENLQKKHTEIPFYQLSDGQVKIPAAWLIEKAGWKGKRIGNVGTYKNQSLVIVNHGNATGSEILNLSKQIRQSVQDLFGITLVPEVNIVE